MGWRGTLRHIEAGMRRAAREADRQNRAAAKQAALTDAQTTVEAYRSYVESITGLHKETVSAASDWQSILSCRQPVAPVDQRINYWRARLAEEKYKPGILTRLLRREGHKRRRLAAAIDLAIHADSSLFEKESLLYQTELAQWNANRAFADRVLSKDPVAYKELLAETNSFKQIEELGSSVSVSIDRVCNVTLDLKIHGTEVVPKEKFTLRTNGMLLAKEMPKSEFNQLYQDYVCSAILRLSAEVFQVLPTSRLLINAQDDLLNTSNGHLERQTIVSVLVVRETFEQLNLIQIDPSDAMKNFLHEMKFSRSVGFSPVTALAYSTVGASY